MLRIMQRKRWRLYFWVSERKIAWELYLQASCPSVFGVVWLTLLWTSVC